MSRASSSPTSDALAFFQTFFSMRRNREHTLCRRGLAICSFLRENLRRCRTCDMSNVCNRVTPNISETDDNFSFFSSRQLFNRTKKNLIFNPRCFVLRRRRTVLANLQTRVAEKSSRAKTRNREAMQAMG